MTNFRKFSARDYLCITIDNAVRAINSNTETTGRPYPSIKEPKDCLTEKDRKLAASLMRVNHAGEVSAQALYHGQAAASKNPILKEKLKLAAVEEGDHLAWCNKRLNELHSHTSYLGPFWYTGSFFIGFIAGMMSDRLSLGFLAETEKQVVEHLANHLHKLPKTDVKSYKILQQMQIDEAHHRDQAISEGAKALPSFVKMGMRFLSKMMVKTAYWI